MTRGTEIEAFTVKLRLAMGHANLSRSAVAHAIGVDKSVVARWLAGKLRPADQSLATLSAALAQFIPGFDRNVWDLPASDFTARLGASPPPPVAARWPGADDPGAEHRIGSLAQLLTQFPNAVPAHELPIAEQRYCGLWLQLSCGVGELLGAACELWRGPSGLEMRLHDGGTQRGSSGPAFARATSLRHIAIVPDRDHRPGFMHLEGTVTRAAVLDGVAIWPTRGRADIPTAMRVVHLRLGAAEPDWRRGSDRWMRLADAVHRQNLTGWEPLMPPVLREAFRLPEGVAAMRLTRDQSLAASELELEQQTDDVRRQALREAVASLRAWHAGQP